MSIYNPPHPGEALREDVLPELKLSTMALAKRIGYSKRRLSTLLNGRSAIKADLAWRLELAGVGKAHMWLDRQAAYDLWCAQHKSVPPITKLGAQQSKTIPNVKQIDQLQGRGSKVGCLLPFEAPMLVQRALNLLDYSSWKKVLVASGLTSDWVSGRYLLSVPVSPLRLVRTRSG